MKSKSKILTALLLSMCMLVVGVAGCTPEDNGSEEDVYNLIFDYNDSSVRSRTVEVEKGESLSCFAKPVRDGYSFAGWYTASEDGEEVVFPYKPDSDKTIYAHWTPGIYDVTFNWNYGDTPETSVQHIEYKSTVSAPAEEPVRTNYVFRYWSLKEDGLTQVTFPYTVTKNVSFYASWRSADIKVFNVTFDYGEYEGAPNDLKYEIEEGTAVQKSQAVEPNRTGYVIKHWSTTQDGLNPVTFPFTPAADATLYAVWEEQTYTMGLRYNYTDSPSTFFKRVDFKANAQIAEPEVPEREGYSFAGWYTTARGGEKVEFPLTLTRNASYFAHWISNSVTTDTFHAEYVSFDPDMKYPGYSGSALGAQCIIPNDVTGIAVDNYPLNSKRKEGRGFYVSYQYVRGAALVFEIYASETINNVSLVVNWASEIVNGGITVGPTGENAYTVSVNGTALNYSPVNITGPNEGGQQYKCGFKEYTLSATFTLNQGKNTIVFETANDNKAMGGTTNAVAPMTDYIRLSYAGSGKLSWHPVYDNLDEVK